MCVCDVKLIVIVHFFYVCMFLNTIVHSGIKTADIVSVVAIMARVESSDFLKKLWQDKFGAQYNLLAQ